MQAGRGRTLTVLCGGRRNCNSVNDFERGACVVKSGPMAPARLRNLDARPLQGRMPNTTSPFENSSRQALGGPTVPSANAWYRTCDPHRRAVLGCLLLLDYVGDQELVPAPREQRLAANHHQGAVVRRGRSGDDRHGQEARGAKRERGRERGRTSTQWRRWGWSVPLLQAREGGVPRR